MRKTGFLYDQEFLLHETGAFHPETPERLTAIHKGISSAGLLKKLRMISGRPVDLEWVETVHPRSYVEGLERACLNGETEFDSPDNQICERTFGIALLAVGGILDTIDLLMTGEIDNVFCAVRPPGSRR